VGHHVVCNCARITRIGRIIPLQQYSVHLVEQSGRIVPRRHAQNLVLLELNSQARGQTLDFTLKSNDGHVYSAEMKCWLEYQNYPFLPLKGPQQLTEADNPAFR